MENTYKPGSFKLEEQPKLPTSNNNKNTSTYVPGAFSLEQKMKDPIRAKALRSEIYSNVAQSRIYGDIEGLDLPSLQDDFRYENYKKSINQSWYERLGGFANQAIVGEIVGGALQGAGTLVDFITPKETQGHQDFRNFLTDWGGNLQEWTREVTPIHRTNPYSTFDFGDPGWWAQNGVSVASSLSLLIPARGVMGLLGAAGKALKVENAIVKTLKGSKIAKNAEVANGLTNTLMKGEQLVANRLKYLAEVGGTATFMRHMENFREAGQVTADTYNESYDFLNDLDDNEFSKWKKDNNEIVKQFVHDTGEDINDKEALANYIASKAGWETYKLNWSNLAFDILQVAPLFKGLTASTRGLQTSLATARAEAAALGKTFTRTDKVLASLAPLGGVLKRQWTEGLEEMINGISTEEGMRLGKILLGQIKEDGSNISDRILNDYLQDSHIWEQGFWGILGGVTFESASNFVQNKYNKYKNTNYTSIKEKAINEIQHRNVILANYGAFNNEIENNRNIYDLDDNGKPKEFKGTAEEINAKKNQVRERLANEVGIELGLNASKVGNIGGLLDYLNSEELATKVAEQNKIDIKDAKKFTSSLSKTVEQTEKAYAKHYTGLTSSNVPSFLHDIILPNNVRDENSIRILNEDLNEFTNNLNKHFNNELLRSAHTEESIKNLQDFVNYKAAESIKKEITDLIAQTKDVTQKRIYEKALESISSTLDIHLNNKPKYTSLEFINSGIDINAIKDAAKILATEFKIAKHKGEIQDRTYNPEYAKEVVETFKNAHKKQEETTKNNFKDEINKLNLKKSWEEVESDFKAIKEKISKNYPDEKSVPIDFKKELEALKKKHGNIQNGVVAENQIEIENQLSKTIEQEELENLGIDFTKEEAKDLIDVLNTISSSELTNQEKINFINEGNIEINIDKLSKEQQDKVLNYFIEKAELLQTLENNKLPNIIEQNQVQDENSVNVNDIVDNNTTPLLEELAFNSDNDSQINLFINAMNDINKLRNSKGNIQVSNEVADKIVDILSLRQGVELVLKVDTNNEQYDKNKSSILQSPIGLFTPEGKSLGVYINKLSYLTNEIQLLNNIFKLNDNDLQSLIDLSRDSSKRTEYVEMLTNKVIKSINIESHGGIENVINHLYKVLNFEPTEDLNRIKSLISNWQFKIVRDYKANYAIRNKIKARKTFTYNVNIAKKTSGDLVIGRDENNKIVFSSIKDIYGDDVQLLVARDKLHLTNEEGIQEMITKSSNLIGDLYVGGVYVKIKENGHMLHLLMKQNTIGGRKDNIHNEAISTYVTNKVLEIAIALQNDDVELAKSIKNELDKYTYTDRSKTDSYNYFSWGKSDKGYYLNFNTTKGKHKLVIGNGVIFIHSDGKQVGEIFTGEGKSNTPTSKKGKFELQNILNNRLRNVDIKAIEKPFGVADEYLEYYDEATNKTYPTYKDYLLETDTLVTHYNHIVRPDGSHVSYFTNKSERNSVNFRTSRPLIINVTAVDNANQDLSLLNISENDFKEEDNVKTKIESVTSLPMLHSVLGFDNNLLFVTDLANQLGVEFNNKIQPNPEEAPNANGMYFKGVVTLFDNFLNPNKNKNVRQTTLIHETLHGIVDKAVSRLSPTAQPIFRRKLKSFTHNLLEKTLDKADNLNSILNYTDKNGVPTFTESQKQYIVEILNKLDEFRKNPTANLRLYDEIVTYTFSSPVFAKFMDSVESDLTLEEIQQDITKKTFWGKLKDILLNVVSSAIKLINGKVTKLTELENILNNLPIFVDNQEITQAITEQGQSKKEEKENKLIIDKNKQLKLFEEVSISNEEFTTIISELEDKLKTFLNKLGITVKEYNELLSITGYNVIGATDLLNKTIYLKENEPINVFAKEVAYIAYSFLGTKNKIRTDLIHSIDSLPNYQEYYNKYLLKNPKLNNYKIKELIVVDFLSDAIYNNWQFPKDSYIHREANYWKIEGSSKIEKQIKYILAKIKRFFYDLFEVSKLNKKEVTDLLNDIANDILNASTSKFFKELTSLEKETNYNETLKNDNKAKEIVTYFQSLGLLLTGSLSLRKQGTIYRTADENVHDLDFTLTNSKLLENYTELKNKDIEEEYNNIIKKYNLLNITEIEKQNILNKLEEERLLKLINNNKLPLLLKIKEKYPSFNIVTVFTNNNVTTITGKIDEHMIDIFITKEDNIDNNYKNFQDWQDIFKAKLRIGRAKDIKDFANYFVYNINPEIGIKDSKGFRHFNFEKSSFYTLSKIVDDNYNNLITLLQDNKTIEKHCP